jgi:hypothetical protein
MPQAQYYAPGTIGVVATVHGWVRPGNPGTGQAPFFFTGGHQNPIHAARSVQLVPIRWGKSRGVQAFSIAAG